MPNRPLELTGQRFGKLVAIRREHKRRRQYMWLCRCDCGNETLVMGSSLKIGNTQACGCEMYKHRATHGHTLPGFRRSEYRSWEAMRARCHRPDHDQFGNYGGRGITVCDEWRDSYKAFFDHVGPKPGPKYSLDRIDNDGNYGPGNVRWATQAEQNKNQRTVASLEARVDGLEESGRDSLP